MHEQILKMIEAVDPSDTAKMDEIDAMVFRYVTKDNRSWVGLPKPKYTRSRDALKAIRPEGFYFNGGFVGKYAEYEADNFSIPRIKFNSGDKLTEELAELHAIIQAVAFERKETP
jgi:hypothetical protein